MAGHSRPKDGVLSHAYVPAISLRDATAYTKRYHWDKPGDDKMKGPARGRAFHCPRLNYKRPDGRMLCQVVCAWLCGSGA